MNASGIETGIKTMAAGEVAMRMSQGQAKDLIDVRTAMEYEQVHAAGARLVPLDQLDPKAVMASRAASADEPVYIICKSGGRAANACQKFINAGYTNVFNVEGGTSAWEQAGLPVVRGRKGISLERQVRMAVGTMVFLGVILGYFVHRAFLVVPAFCGAGLVFAGATEWCGMGLLLARMPWNKGAACQKCQ